MVTWPPGSASGSASKYEETPDAPPDSGSTSQRKKKAGGRRVDIAELKLPTAPAVSWVENADSTPLEDTSVENNDQGPEQPLADAGGRRQSAPRIPSALSRGSMTSRAFGTAAESKREKPKPNVLRDLFSGAHIDWDYDNGGQRTQILKYDVPKLANWGFLLLWKGTAVSRYTILRALIMSGITTAIALHTCKRDSDNIETNNCIPISPETTWLQFSQLVSFLLGFFVTVTLNRWWATRERLQHVMGKSVTICMLFQSYAVIEDAETDRVRRHMLRWFNLAFRLVFKAHGGRRSGGLLRSEAAAPRHGRGGGGPARDREPHRASLHVDFLRASEGRPVRAPARRPVELRRAHERRADCDAERGGRDHGVRQVPGPLLLRPPPHGADEPAPPLRPHLLLRRNRRRPERGPAQLGAHLFRLRLDVLQPDDLLRAPEHAVRPGPVRAELLDAHQPLRGRLGRLPQEHVHRAAGSGDAGGHADGKEAPTPHRGDDPERAGAGAGETGGGAPRDRERRGSRREAGCPGGGYQRHRGRQTQPAGRRGRRRQALSTPPPLLRSSPLSSPVPRSKEPQPGGRLSLPGLAALHAPGLLFKCSRIDIARHSHFGRKREVGMVFFNVIVGILY